MAVSISCILIIVSDLCVLCIRNSSVWKITPYSGVDLLLAVLNYTRNCMSIDKIHHYLCCWVILGAFLCFLNTKKIYQ